MPLRPVNAIFVHPKKRFYVVYTNGELWQLAKMHLDINAWKRKEVYTDSTSELYLAKDQKIEDTELAKIIPLMDFPITLQSAPLEKFEQWWSANGALFLKKHRTAKDTTSKQAPVPQIHETDAAKESMQAEASTAEKLADKTATDATQTTQDNIQQPKDGSLTQTDIDKPNLEQPNSDAKPKQKAVERSHTGDVFEDLLTDLNNDLL